MDASRLLKKRLKHLKNLRKPIVLEKLDDGNFLLYCARVYDNPHCHSTAEFLEDVKRIKYIKKLFTRYIATGELKERLILNHVIILNNVFGAEHLPRILFLKMPKHLPYIKPFLVLLEIMPPIVWNIGKDGTNYNTDFIAMDPGIVEALRKL